MHGGGLLVTRRLLLHVLVHHLLLLVLVVKAVCDFSGGVGVIGPISEQIMAIFGSGRRAEGRLGVARRV